MVGVTQIIAAIERGEPQASEALLPLVYDELRRLADRNLAQEKPGQTLSSTALVHEAYLRLVGKPDHQLWDGRGHFFAAAAEAMRRILVENARRKGRVKHGGGLRQVELDERVLSVAAPDDHVLAVDEALDLLAQVDREAAQVVKLHYFTGLTMEETAQVLQMSTSSVYRNWSFARAWLFQRLKNSKS